MADYRDPKVTTTRDKGGKKWLWIALAIIAALLLLWWLFSSGEDEVATEADPAAVVVEPADEPVEPAAPAN